MVTDGRKSLRRLCMYNKHEHQTVRFYSVCTELCRHGYRPASAYRIVSLGRQASEV